MSLTQSGEVVSHLLYRIKEDPRLAYYFDPLTMSMELLTAAYAAERGLDVEVFRKAYYAQLSFEAPKCSDCGEAVNS